MTTNTIPVQITFEGSYCAENCMFSNDESSCCNLFSHQYRTPDTTQTKYCRVEECMGAEINYNE